MSDFSSFLARRLVQSLITLFIVTTIVWLIFWALPGDPATPFRTDPRLRPLLPALERQFGLDKPEILQYFYFLKAMFTLNLGFSIFSQRPVAEILFSPTDGAVWRTLLWFVPGTLIAYYLGNWIGRYIAWRRGGAAEGVTVVSSLFFYNMPSFWIGLIFIFVFAHKFDWFPLGGFSRPSETIDHFNLSPSTPDILITIIDRAWHLILPMTVLLAISIAGNILLMRTSLLETLGEDYILTARAKGLSERAVRDRHAGRNAKLPVVTSNAIALAYSVGGGIVIETVFSYPGMGFTYFDALIRQDYYLAGAALFIIALLVIVGNLIADIMYAWLDPRVRL